MESVCFHLKYWLKLTYPVVAWVCMLAQCRLSWPWSRQPNDVMSEIECAQLHREFFRCRHNTLQSHSLFALAKHLISWAGEQNVHC